MTDIIDITGNWTQMPLQHTALLLRNDEVEICVVTKKLPFSPTLRCDQPPAGPADSSSHLELAHPLALPIEAGGLSMRQLAAAMKNDAALQERLVQTLGRVLDFTVARNDAACRARSPKSQLSSFESNSQCPLKPSAYLQRIQKYTVASPCNFLIGILYLQRLRDRDQDKKMLLTSFNIQRYLLTAIMLASKTFDDYYMPNKQWALVGNLSLKEMNELELDMLFALSFSMSVHREEYDICSQDIEDLDNAIVGQAMQSVNVKSLKSELAHPRDPLSPS